MADDARKETALLAGLLVADMVICLRVLWQMRQRERKWQEMANGG